MEIVALDCLYFKRGRTITDVESYWFLLFGVFGLTTLNINNRAYILPSTTAKR